MFDLSATSAELDDAGGTFKREQVDEARLIDNVHTSRDLQPFSKVELHALAFPNDAALCLIVEEEIQEFQQTQQAALKFPPMSAFHRRLVSDCAARWGLESMTLGTGDARHAVVMKTEAAAATPLLPYLSAIPTQLPKEKLQAMIGFTPGYPVPAGKKGPSTEYAAVNGQIMMTRSLKNSEALQPYTTDGEHKDTDRADWMRLVHHSVRKGIPIATHAHIVEVRMDNAEKDAHFAELQKFLGPFSVKWLGGTRGSGVGVIIYPSVPAANNCLDRYEDEDDPSATRGRLPFRLYPFAPHITGPFVDDQAIRRFRSDSNAGPPSSSYGNASLGRSPGSQGGGSWREREGNSFLDRQMAQQGGGNGSNGKWAKEPSDRLGSSPPLVPKGTWSGRGTPKGSPAVGPGSYRSPASGAQSGAPHVQPMSLGKGKWHEAKAQAAKNEDRGAAAEAGTMPQKSKMEISKE